MARNVLSETQSQIQHTFVAINGKESVRSLADATATLWKSGQPDVQFWPFHRSQRSSYEPVALPPYQFEKHRHWLEHNGLSIARDKKTDGHAPARSGLCPHCSKDISDFSYISQDQSQTHGTGKTVFKIDTRSRRYQDLVKGHAVVGFPICPAAMYLELASHAVALLQDTQVIAATQEIVAESLAIKAPLGLDAQRSVRLTLIKETDGVWSFELSSTKNNAKAVSHSTGIISLRHSRRSINNEQDSKDKWDRITSLLEKDPDTEALRGTMVYKVFSKMAKYSSAFRGLRHLVGKGSESAGDIVMPIDDLDVMAQTPNPSISDPLVMDNFLQVPGAFVHSLRATDEEEDGSTSYICTGMGSVGPLNGLQGSGEYRAYAKIVQEGQKDVVLNVFAFDKKDKKIIWSAKGLKFSKVPRNSLAKVLEGANPAMGAKELPTAPLTSGASVPAPKSSYPATPTLDSLPKKSKRGDESSANILSGIREVLSKSLDVEVKDVTKEATLEDLGSDSLVSSEILANISEKFKIDILTDEFAAVTDVASLCNLISARIGGSPDPSGDNDEDQGQDSLFQTADDVTLDWKKTVLEILSQSLDLSVAEIQMDSKLDDIGADSLVAAEIVSNLNEGLSLEISSTEFSSLVDVASLCNLIASTLGVNSAQSPTDSFSSTSRTRSTSRASIPVTPYTGAATPVENEKPTLSNGNTGSTHAAFLQIRRNFDAHAKDTKLTGYWDNVYPQQLSTVTAFIIEAFEKLGCRIRDFKRGEKLPDVQGTLARYHREVPRLWEILVEAGIVDKSSHGFLRGHSDISDRSAKDLSTELISDFPPYASTHGLPDLLGPYLAECLTGKADPVPLLFGSDKGRSLLEDFYANGPDLLAATKVLCDFFSAAIHSKTSDGEPFRVLEIGAGTGGTTKHLVPLLQATGLPFTYTFTELSVSLLNRAKKTFSGVAGMEFRKLNIEEEPPQELLGRYHVVVSSNCVHATRDLRRCLTNIRKVVRSDDGCVALVELTQKLAWYDLVWGLLDGWWLFDDGREYALQSPWAWERAMQDSGFSHVDWSESASRESRGVRVICGMASKLEVPCPVKSTSMLLRRGISASEGRNLFLAPDGFGSGAVFGTLPPLLSGVKDVSVYALNSPFLKNKPDPDQLPTIEELAAIYVAEIKRRQPEGPYLVGGYSVGGVIAFEVARQLLEDGNEVEKLILIDTVCPTFGNSMPDALVGFLDSINLVGMVNEDENQGKSKGQPIRSDHFTLARQQLLEYKVSKLPGRKMPQVMLVSAKEGVDKQDQVSRPVVLPEEQRIVDWFLDDRIDQGSFGWDELLEGVHVIRADGNHFSMMKPPMVSN